MKALEDYPALMSVAEVAKATGMGERLVRTAIAEGQLPHVRWGRRILVPRPALEAQLTDPPSLEQRAS